MPAFSFREISLFEIYFSGFTLSFGNLEFALRIALHGNRTLRGISIQGRICAFPIAPSDVGFLYGDCSHLAVCGENYFFFDWSFNWRPSCLATADDIGFLGKLLAGFLLLEAV